MTEHEPIVKPNSRYSIEETCRHLGIHRNTLLKYTKLGRIRYGVRTVTLRKFYTGSEILRFWKAQL